MRFLLLAYLIISSIKSFATANCGQALAEARPLNFRQVEIYRRNNNVGQQQVGDLHFKTWFEVGPFTEGVSNFIGMTEDGHIYHLISWQDRKIARLLSGQRVFKSIYLRDGHLLTATDQNDNLLFYSPSTWLTSPLKSLMQKGLTYTVAGSATAVAVLSFLFPDLMSMQLAPVITTSAVAFSTFFAMVQRYDRLNTFPDGFIEGHEVNPRDLALTSWAPPEENSLAPRTPAEATEDHRKP